MRLGIIQLSVISYQLSVISQESGFRREWRGGETGKWGDREISTHTPKPQNLNTPSPKT
ncbi:MAG: hypothetical protein GPJ18_05385 [Microcystis aeruginosa F13-15]|nr:hypothetical protein [Microcystis aeruginosa F13-15]